MIHCLHAAAILRKIGSSGVINQPRGCLLIGASEHAVHGFPPVVCTPSALSDESFSQIRRRQDGAHRFLNISIPLAAPFHADPVVSTRSGAMDLSVTTDTIGGILEYVECVVPEMSGTPGKRRSSRQLDDRSEPCKPTSRQSASSERSRREIEFA